LESLKSSRNEADADVVALTPRAELERERQRCIELDGFDPRFQRHPEAPKTYAECEDGERPCIWVGCKHNLYLDVRPRSTGASIHINQACEPEDVDPLWSCALDVAKRSQARQVTLLEISTHYGFTRERIRQIEVEAMARLKRGILAMGIPEETIRDVLASAFESASSLGPSPATDDDDTDLEGNGPSARSL
jgi:hypothetical protein